MLMFGLMFFYNFGLCFDVACCLLVLLFASILITLGCLLMLFAGCRCCCLLGFYNFGLFLNAVCWLLVLLFAWIFAVAVAGCWFFTQRHVMQNLALCSNFCKELFSEGSAIRIRSL